MGILRFMGRLPLPDMAGRLACHVRVVVDQKPNFASMPTVRGGL
jgi:hypothetical protein